MSGNGARNDLRKQLTRSEKIIDALIERVERATDFSASDLDGTNYRDTAFSVFETAAAWDWRVRARTADQRRALEDLAKALADLEHVNAALQREIRERTAIEEALIRAKLLAEQHNAEKTRFLAAVSHDLIQPLNAARLFVGALANRRLRGQSKKLVGQASSALDSVEDILEALLEIAQLDAGAIQPVVEPINLEGLLHHLAGEFDPVARDKGLTLEISSAPLTVHSDAQLLRRILQNLISNSLRYTDKGGASVRATCTRGEVTVVIQDTGHGIARKHRKMIFREFSRLEGRHQVGSAGLGLAIVDRAVRMLGHRLSLTSRLGVGTTFRLRLAGHRHHITGAAIVRAAKTCNFAGKSILVVENEPDSLDALGALLKGWGCAVSLACSEPQAIEACSDTEARPDLVIADYHLDKGLTGDNVILALRAQLGERIPGIIVTADRSQALLSALANLDLPVLHKPVKPESLRELVSGYLRLDQ